jgi:caa(3)-type oxidase subunit IV
MSDSHAHDVSKEIKGYIAVFVSLAVLTVVTVWVSNFEFTVAMGILVALIIAVFKGSLVASFFMHLVSEKKGIVWVLILTAVFFLALIFLPLGALMDQQGVPTNVP